MRFVTQDEDLRCGVTLDTEDRRVDLTSDGLGAALLEEFVAGLLDCHSRRVAPDGTPWADLAPATVRRKHHAVLGIASGRSHLLDPDLWRSLPRRIEPRAAWLWFPRGDRRWGQVHGWQNGVDRNRMPARPLLGWTEGARQECRDLVRQAEFRAGE